MLVIFYVSDINLWRSEKSVCFWFCFCVKSIFLCTWFWTSKVRDSNLSTLTQRENLFLLLNHRLVDWSANYLHFTVAVKGRRTVTAVDGKGWGVRVVVGLAGCPTWYSITCSVLLGVVFFFFCVPSHARFSVRWVRRSPQSAAVSQPVPKASCGLPPDWAMSDVSSHRRWGRIAGCGWGFEGPCCVDIRLSGKEWSD